MLSIMHKLDLSGKPDPKRCEPVLSIRLHGVGNVFLFQMLLLHPQISTWAFDTPNVQPIIKSCSPIQKLFAFHNVTPIVQPDYKRLYLPTCTSCSPIINVCTFPHVHHAARLLTSVLSHVSHPGMVQPDYKRLPFHMSHLCMVQPDYKRLYLPTCTSGHRAARLQTSTFPNVTLGHHAARL